MRGIERELPQDLKVQKERIYNEGLRVLARFMGGNIVGGGFCLAGLATGKMEAFGIGFAILSMKPWYAAVRGLQIYQKGIEWQEQVKKWERTKKEVLGSSKSLQTPHNS